MGSAGLLHRATGTTQPDGAESGESLGGKPDSVSCANNQGNRAWSGSDTPATPTVFQFHFRAWAAGMERFL